MRGRRDGTGDDRRAAGVALLAAAALGAAPPAAAAEPCERRAEGPLFRAQIVTTRVGDDVYRSAVTACDRRTGRRRVLARTSRRVLPGGRVQGGDFTDAAAGGRYVAWAHVRYGRPAKVGRVVLAHVSRRVRIVGRRIVHRGRRAPWIEVALTTRAELAWVVGSRIHLVAPGRAPRLVATGASGSLAFEDDRTLRWRDVHATLRYLDLRPPPVRDGCPVRERFRPVLRSPLVVLSEATYVRGLDPAYGEVTTVLRACFRGAGDRVIAQSRSEYGAYDRSSVVGVDGRWVVLSRSSGSRYGCGLAGVAVVDARNGRTVARVGSSTWCRFGWGLPDRGSPIAVTDRGLPAWIVRDVTTGEDVLLSAGADGAAGELDRGPAGSITALRSDGPRIVWLSGGRPRSAEPCCHPRPDADPVRVHGQHLPLADRRGRDARAAA